MKRPLARPAPLALRVLGATRTRRVPSSRYAELRATTHLCDLVATAAGIARRVQSATRLIDGVERGHGDAVPVLNDVAHVVGVNELDVHD